MHQIALNTSQFFKKLQLLRGAHPPSDTPLRRYRGAIRSHIVRGKSDLPSQEMNIFSSRAQR